MAWIESHQTLGHHPKTLKLARELKCGVPAAIGYLHLMWWWALDYAPNGLVAADDKPMVARACMWSRRSEQFWAALLTSGFVEVDGDNVLKIHDWMDYAGRLNEQRALRKESNRRAQTKRRQRLVSAESAVTVTPRQQPTGPDLTGPNRTGPPTPHAVSADMQRCYRCQRLEGEPPTPDCKNTAWHSVVELNGT